MAGLVESRTYDALLTTTLANYREQLIDNIFDVYPFLSWLNGKLGEGVRKGKSIKKELDGGESIVEQLMYAMNTTANSYSGADLLDTTLQEGLTIARYNWKQYAATIGITGLERRSNNGEAAMISLVNSKTKQAEMSLRDKMSVDAFGDGTGNSSKALTGLAALISTSATVGGLSPTTFTWWQSNVTTSAGSFAATGLSKMRTTYNNLSMGNDKPDVIFTTQSVFESYESILQPQERYQNTNVANSGFTNLTFKGIPVLYDRDCTSGYMYMLNSNYINFQVHKDAYFYITDFVTPNDQDLGTAKILFQGNLTVNNRRMHGVIQGFTA